MREREFKTDRQRATAERDMRIYTEFKELTSVPGTSVTKVTEYLMKKYSIYSPSTIWLARRNAERRLSAGLADTASKQQVKAS